MATKKPNPFAKKGADKKGAVDCKKNPAACKKAAKKSTKKGC